MHENSLSTRVVSFCPGMASLLSLSPGCQNVFIRVTAIQSAEEEESILQSPFDRGFDEVQPRRSEHVHPVIDRNLSSKGAKRVNVKMFLAIAMVGVLSITAFMALTLPAKS